MDAKEARDNSIKAIHSAEEIKKTMETPGWQILMNLLMDLEAQEFRALSGAKIDHTYYRKIGFLEITKYVQAIPNIIKDKKIREFLLHQGRAKALEHVRELPHYFFKVATQARQVLDRMNVKPPSKEEIKNYHEGVYREG